MVFWVGILIGAAVAFLAIRQGLYETWAIMFNAVISVYLAIALCPVAKGLLPRGSRGPYDEVLVMLALGVGFFVLLYGIVYVLVLSQFKVNLGKMLDSIAAGGLGFAGGLLIWGFALILISSSPLAKNKVIRGMGIERENIQANISYVSWCTGLVDSVVGSGSPGKSIFEAVDTMLKKHIKPKEEPAEQSQPNQADVQEPNST